VVKGWEYLSETIFDYQNDLGQIGRAFEKLLADPRLHSKGYCLEKYLDEHSVQCMVCLADD
jgi:hypothetical protein